MTNKSSGCYVIAEIGVNHNGSPDLARQLIDAAASAGADAVKFQTFFADELVTRLAKKADYQVANTDNADSQYSMLKALELTEDDFAGLRAYCDKVGIEFLSTPFSEAAADLLERVGVSKFKVSSGDLTHLGLLRHLAGKGKPILLSSGMGTLGEIEEALAVIAQAGNPPVSLFHCVSDYPAAPETCNLAAMQTMSRAFGVPVGWSDHTLGAAVSFAAVALGAKLIEKHITLDQNMPGPDHRASMEPDDFRTFVSGIRAIESAIGDGQKRPSQAELRTAMVARRSIVIARDMKAGEILCADDLRVMRPGSGLAPRYLDMVIGSRLSRDVTAQTPLTKDHINGG